MQRYDLFHLLKFKFLINILKVNIALKLKVCCQNFAVTKNFNSRDIHIKLIEKTLCNQFVLNTYKH